MKEPTKQNWIILLMAVVIIIVFWTSFNLGYQRAVNENKIKGVLTECQTQNDKTPTLQTGGCYEVGWFNGTADICKVSRNFTISDGYIKLLG